MEVTDFATAGADGLLPCTGTERPGVLPSPGDLRTVTRFVVQEAKRAAKKIIIAQYRSVTCIPSIISNLI